MKPLIAFLQSEAARYRVSLGSDDAVIRNHTDQLAQWACDVHNIYGELEDCKQRLAADSANAKAWGTRANVLSKALEQERSLCSALKGALRAGGTPLPELLRFTADRLVCNGDSDNTDFVQALRNHAQRIEYAIKIIEEAE